MCNGHAHIRRLAQVTSHTLIVFIAPNRLCDYEKLLHQNVHQYAVFPIYFFSVIWPKYNIIKDSALHTSYLAVTRQQMKD